MLKSTHYYTTEYSLTELHFILFGVVLGVLCKISLLGYGFYGLLVVVVYL